MRRFLARCSSEYDGPGVAKSKNLAMVGGLIGGFTGGIIVYVLFSMTVLFVGMHDGYLLVSIGTLAGAALGALCGVLAFLRSWGMKPQTVRVSH
jgi:hypothetical protein